MEKVTGHPRLYRRGTKYYHRAAIPVDIADTYPKSEETSSLKTSDYKEALRLVRIEAACVDGLFAAHRQRLALEQQPPLQELTDDQIKRIEEVYYWHLLDEDEDVRLEQFEGSSFEEYAEDGDYFEGVARHGYSRGEPGVFFRDEAEEVLSWENVNLRLAANSPSWPKVVRALQKAVIRAAKVKRSRSEGEPIDTPPMPEATASDPPQQAPAVRRGGSPLLSEISAEWLTEKTRTSWVPKSANEHRVWMKHFIALAGDKPLADYNKADARAFKLALLHLPANWVKLPAIRDLPLKEAAEKARELGLTPMSDTNRNKLLTRVGSFWTWAQKHYDDCPANPFRGLTDKSRNKRAKDERDPFTLDELKAIFSAPMYTGCLSARRWSTPGPLIQRDMGDYWVPLIALFTGARAGEIIQLYTTDVREEHGVLLFDINKLEEDKRLKNLNSERVIPVHPTLVDLGLLALVERRRRDGQLRLFPEMKKGSDGYYSSPFSKHFSRFLKSIKVKTGKNTFHSFRHCFEDACRDSDIPEEVRDTMQGHGASGMAGRYGRGYFLQKLDREMKKLRYDGLDLSHLRPAEFATDNQQAAE
jgi:integrase